MLTGKILIIPPINSTTIIVCSTDCVIQCEPSSFCSLANFYNPLYPYGYGGINMNNGIPYADPINYNQFNPNNFGIINRRTAAAFDTNNRPSSQTI